MCGCVVEIDETTGQAYGKLVKLDETTGQVYGDTCEVEKFEENDEFGHGDM